MEKITVGYAMCGSYCTFDKAIAQMEVLKNMGYDILPIMSENASTIDTRFGDARDIIKRVESISGKKIINTIKDAEPIGPKQMCDIIVS